MQHLRPKNMKKLIYPLIICLVFSNCESNKENTCKLSGQVIDRDSKVLILNKQTEDQRNHGIEIPIDSSGAFYYELSFQFLEAYELIFKDELEEGAWRPIYFFPDNDEIEFTLFPIQKADSNKIIGSNLSLKQYEYEQIISDTFYKRYMYWEQKMDSLKKCPELNAKYEELISDSINAIIEAVPLFELNYAVEEQNIYGYSSLLKILRDEKNRRLYDIDTLIRYCNLFEKKFPNHPYNEIAKYRLNGLTNIKVGGEFIDFSALDTSGTTIKFSNLVNANKLTLLDLWAKWCGPCIRKSQKVVPIYEKYNNSGFNVIGVVGGVNSYNAYQEAVNKYNYEWVVLAEINDENKLWEKYGISKGGGGQFLIDRDGKIIAINPTPEELEKFIID